MKKRTLVRILSFALAAFAVSAGFAVKYASENRAYRQSERYAGFLAMSELSDAAEGMSRAFEAAVYARSPEVLASLSNAVWLQSAAAVEALSRLPVYDARIENTRIFLSRAGDYAAYLSRAAVTGGTGENEREALSEMSQAAKTLSSSLRALESDIYSGNVLFSGVCAPNNGAVFRFGDIEEAASYPSPEYEGVMAESYLSRTGAALENAQEIGADQASEIAARALACDREALESGGESKGNIACYVFRNGEDETQITKQGGYVLTLRKTEAEAPEEMETFAGSQDLERKAAQALAALGFADMTCIHAVQENDGIDAVFVPVENGVRCDPDTVRVRFTRDGGLTQLNAAGYVLNHHARDLRALDGGTQDILPQELSMEYAGNAVVDSGFGREYLCREYRASLEDGRTLVIFCDAESGTQRKIEIRQEQA